MAQPTAQANPAATVAAPPARSPIIQLQHVTKTFGDIVGVDDLNFEVYEGEIFGFIGPSGSGKTTAMRLINGIYAPTSGEVRLLGTNPAKPKQGWGHSTPEMAIAVAQAANAGQMVLFHHEPTYDDATIAEIEANAQKLFPNVRAAYEGMELKI